MTILDAWNIAVQAFRLCDPERYITFQEFWLDEEYELESATDVEMLAFDVLHNEHLQLPVWQMESKRK